MWNHRSYEPVIVVDSVIRLADDSALIACKVSIEAEISYLIERSNWGVAIEMVKPHIINPEHNDYYMEASERVELFKQLLALGVQYKHVNQYQ